MSDILLGNQPAQLTVFVTDGDAFAAELVKADGTDWDDGTVASLLLGETPFDATVDGTVLSWSITAADWAEAIDGDLTPAAVSFGSGAAKVTLATGFVITNPTNGTGFGQAQSFSAPGVPSVIVQPVAGPAGPAGPGVASGGAEGAVLVKATSTNFDTEWVELGTAASHPATDFDAAGAASAAQSAAAGDASTKAAAAQAAAISAAAADATTKIAAEATARTAAITAAVDALVNGAPGALDTLNELAAALGDDQAFAATVTAALAAKAPLASAALTNPTINGHTPVTADQAGSVFDAAGAAAAAVPPINVVAYGAVGDTLLVPDLTITASSTTATATTAPFANAMVGKVIDIDQGGGNPVLTTTVAAYVSASQITLTDAPGVSGTTQATIGTDDSTAIVSALAAAQAAGRDLYFPGTKDANRTRHYKCHSALGTINPRLTALLGDGGARSVIDFMGAAPSVVNGGAYCITFARPAITNSSIALARVNDPTVFAARIGFLGPRASSAAVDLMLLGANGNGTGDVTAADFLHDNIAVWGFRWQMTGGGNCYCLRGRNSNFNRPQTGWWHWAASATNSGENMSWEGCQFLSFYQPNSTVLTSTGINTAGTSFSFMACSFDFGQRIASIASGKLYFDEACHFESPNSGGGGTLDSYDHQVELVLPGGSTPTFSDPQVYLNGYWVARQDTTTNQAFVKITGTASPTSKPAVHIGNLRVANIPDTGALSALMVWDASTANGSPSGLAPLNEVIVTATNIVYDDARAGAVNPMLYQDRAGSTHALAAGTRWSSKGEYMLPRAVSVISSPTTAGGKSGTDYIYIVSGTTTLTLPTAVGNASRYTVKNSGSNTVSVATTSAQTLDGSASPITIAAGDSLDLISDGANWRLI